MESKVAKGRVSKSLQGVSESANGFWDSSHWQKMRAANAGQIFDSRDVFESVWQQSAMLQRGLVCCGERLIQSGPFSRVFTLSSTCQRCYRRIAFIQLSRKNTEVFALGQLDSAKAAPSQSTTVLIMRGLGERGLFVSIYWWPGFEAEYRVIECQPAGSGRSLHEILALNLLPQSVRRFFTNPADTTFCPANAFVLNGLSEGSRNHSSYLARAGLLRVHETLPQDEEFVLRRSTQI